MAKDQPSLIDPEYIKQQKRLVAKSITKISFEDITSIDLFFINKRETPKTKSILAIFDPKIPPIAISEFPFSSARIVTNNSGKEVPKPKIKIPIIKGGTSSLLDKSLAPKTNLSPPKASNIIPKGKRKVSKGIILFNNVMKISLLV